MVINFSNDGQIHQIYMSKDDLDILYEIEKLERKSESGGKDYATIPKSELFHAVPATV